MKKLAIIGVFGSMLLLSACECKYVPSHVDRNGKTSQGSNWCRADRH